MLSLEVALAGLGLNQHRSGIRCLGPAAEWDSSRTRLLARHQLPLLWINEGTGHGHRKADLTCYEFIRGLLGFVSVYLFRPLLFHLFIVSSTDVSCNQAPSPSTITFTPCYARRNMKMPHAL
jgi:hypothetical protein